MLLLTTRAKEVIIDPIDWPRCAICHLPVEEFTATDTGNSLYFMSQCHGDREIVEVPDELWDEALETYAVDIGTAFGEEDE